MKTKLSVSYRLFAVLSFLAFITYAFYVNSFGTNASTMMKFFHITEKQQGFVITVQSIGGLITAIWLSLFGERYNKIYVIALCIGLMAVGSILIGLMPLYTPEGNGYVLLLMFVILAGIGYTGVDVMMNGVITEVYPENKNTLLPIAHAFFGTGAMIAPSFVAVFADSSKPSSFAVPFIIIGIMSFVVFAAYLLTGRRITPSTPYAKMDDMYNKASENPAEIFKSPKAWLFLLAGVLYFSFQYGLIVWMPTYFSYEKGFSGQLSAMMATIFSLGALVMRFISPIIFKRTAINKFYNATAILSAVCMAVAFSITSIPLVTGLVFVGGFLQGALVVAFVVMSCNEFPTRTASASAITVISFNLSAMVVPLIVGAMAEVYGFTIPMYILTICLIGSAFTMWIAQRRGLSHENVT